MSDHFAEKTENKMKDMKKYIRRALPKLAAVIAAAVMCVPVLPQNITATASAVDVYQFNENGFYYTISAVSGTIEASVVGYKSPNNGPTGGITIPATLGSYAVTSIGADAFAEDTTLTTVSIPQSVRSIGRGAFQNCTGLTTASMAAGVTSISENAFKGCTSLATANIPASVTSIGTSAFEDCMMLKTLTLPATLTYIGNYTFRRCSTIETVIIPNSVTAIGEGAFESCTKLKNLTLSTGLMQIEDFTFYRCTSLTPLNLPENITSVGRYAFSECSSLSSVTFPKSVLTIGASAFENSQYLAVAIIPNTTTTIASTAFRNAPVSIYGYTGTYAEQFARENSIPFTSYGSVYKVTFSADIYYASIDNISVRSRTGVIIPPSTVQNDEELTISATAPDGYVIDHITINDAPFTNGSIYRVHNSDVNIFVSYRFRELTPSVTTPEAPATAAPVVTTQVPQVTTVTTTTTTTTSTTTQTAPPAADDDPGDQDDPDDPEDTTVPADNSTQGSDDPSVSVDNRLEGIGDNNVRLITQRSNFISSATVRLSNTPQASSAAEEAAQSLAGDRSAYFYGFDISLYDTNGRENAGIMASGTVTLQVPVPDILAPYMDDIEVYHIEDGEPVRLSSSIVEDINGVKRVQFETTSFSPYLFVVFSDDGEIVTINEEEDPTGDGEGEVNVVTDEPPQETERVQVVVPGNVDNDSNSGNHSGGTGRLNPGTGALLLIGIPSVTLGCAFLIRKGNKEKRTRTKREIK